MLKNLLTLLITGLVLYVVYFIAGLLVHGTILMIVGIILLIVLIWKACEIFGINI